MFKRQYLSTDSEFVVPNGNGDLAPVKRNRVLWNVVLSAAGAVLLHIGERALGAAERSVVVKFSDLRFAGLVDAAILKPSPNYKKPRPQIALRTGLPLLLRNTPEQNSGLVTIGNERSRLGKNQVREKFIGRRYEIVMVVPQ